MRNNLPTKLLLQLLPPKICSSSRDDLQSQATIWLLKIRCAFEFYLAFLPTLRFVAIEPQKNRNEEPEFGNEDLLKKRGSASTER